MQEEEKRQVRSKSSYYSDSEERKSRPYQIANNEEEPYKITLEYLNSCAKEVLVDILYSMIKNEKY